MLVLLLTVGRGMMRVVQYPTAITMSRIAPVTAAPVPTRGGRFRLSDSMGPAPADSAGGCLPVLGVHPEYISRCSGRLKREHLPRRIPQLELVREGADASHTLHRGEHVIELVAQRDPAQCHAILVREHLYAPPVLYVMIKLGGDSCRELMIGARLSFYPAASTPPRFASGISQEKRRPYSEARYQSNLFSSIRRHFL